jgi:hypothetical protein
MATKQSSWQKTNLSQPKVKIIVITTLVATKPCRCDKKAWYKGQKLVVQELNQSMNVNLF